MATIHTECLQVTDDVIAAASVRTGHVMIARECRWKGQRSHKRPHKRNGVWGVRVGKRGTAFSPLTSCKKTDVDGTVIYQFKTW